jgi:hypothetical protein
MPKPIPNECITFAFALETYVQEYAGIQEGARLYAQACGIDIYTVGSDPDKYPDVLNNLMMSACIARHIPVISLHLCGVAKIRSNRKNKTETKEMF